MRQLKLRVTMPGGVDFADLHLPRSPDDGLVRFKMAPIEAISEASALDLGEIAQGPQPLVGLLIAAWYETPIAQGSPPDPVQEGLMEEARLEMEHGDGFAYPPGHA